nr:ribonuclease H-like domain-containing protein [Tanacetum cinerariifolium]
YNCPKLKNNNNNNRGNQVGTGNAQARVYAMGNAGINPDANTVTEMGSFDVIIGMDWLSRYEAVIVCADKIVRIPWGRENLIFHSDGSNQEHECNAPLRKEDVMKKNDVKARTTLLLSLPDEHQLRFSKYKTARELWAAILKTFGSNEATKKTKKNLLKQQYGNFKAEGSETLEQTFNILQVIVGQLQFMNIEIEQDDLNQKFLTSLAPKWLMHTIVWRNRSYLDTMSLDDLYNHLRVYESEVQKKSDSNSQNMAFISSAKHSSGNEDGNTVCVPTASTNVPTASASVATISQDCNAPLRKEDVMS